MAYDVFISYRRETGADDARLLQQALKARGYNVFFDYDSLRDGKFDEKIFEAIDEAPVFVLMLTERALDRCVNADDWVRLEIERALSKGKKIISVAPSFKEWSFPEQLPDSLCAVKTEQASELNKASLFDESIDKMIQNRFPSSLKTKLNTNRSSSLNARTKGKRPKTRGKDFPRIDLQCKYLLKKGRYALSVTNGGRAPIEITISVSNGRKRKVLRGIVEGRSSKEFGNSITGVIGWCFRHGDHGTIKVAGYAKSLKFEIDENGYVSWHE